jgi:hypothetical protein
MSTVFPVRRLKNAPTSVSAEGSKFIHRESSAFCTKKLRAADRCAPNCAVDRTPAAVRDGSLICLYKSNSSMKALAAATTLVKPAW